MLYWRSWNEKLVHNWCPNTEQTKAYGRLSTLDFGDQFFTKELMFIVCLLVCLFVCLLVCLFICLFTWCSCSSCPLFGKYEKSILSYFYETTKTNTHMTFDLEPRSKLNAQNESPYMVSYMSAIQSKSLSCIVFEIFKKKCISDLWPLTKWHWMTSAKK